MIHPHLPLYNRFKSYMSCLYVNLLNHDQCQHQFLHKKLHQFLLTNIKTT